MASWTHSGPAVSRPEPWRSPTAGRSCDRCFWPRPCGSRSCRTCVRAAGCPRSWTRPAAPGPTVSVRGSPSVRSSASSPSGRSDTACGEGGPAPWPRATRSWSLTIAPCWSTRSVRTVSSVSCCAPKRGAAAPTLPATPTTLRRSRWPLPPSSPPSSANRWPRYTRHAFSMWAAARASTRRSYSSPTRWRTLRPSTCRRTSSPPPAMNSIAPATARESDCTSETSGTGPVNRRSASIWSCCSTTSTTSTHNTEMSSTGTSPSS